MKKISTNLGILIIAIASLTYTFAISTTTPFAVASTSEDEEAPSDEEATTTTPPATTDQVTLGSSVPAAPADTTSTTAAQDFVRARLQLFNVPANAPNIIAWINVPSQNATSVDTITSAELDASNNVTGDGIGELFISLPNATSQINQQIEGCALDIVDKVPMCDNAFTASTNASTPLQVMLGGQQQQGAPQ